MQRPDTAQLRALSDAEEQLWRQRVGALQAAPDLIRRLGADPQQVLAAAGLPESAFELPDNTVPYAACGRFYHLAAQSTGCEHFGLLVGQSWQLQSLGLLGELMRNAPTVGEALRKICVYHHLNSQGGVVMLRADGAMAEFGYAIYHRSVLGVRRQVLSANRWSVAADKLCCRPVF